eukprot:8296877-Lingulodinium_polyedra.AAC.1
MAIGGPGASVAASGPMTTASGLGSVRRPSSTGVGGRRSRRVDRVPRTARMAAVTLRTQSRQ